MRVHEMRIHVPDGFSLNGAAHLTPHSVYDVSTPSSVNYGSHLSKEAVRIVYTPAGML